MKQFILVMAGILLLSAPASACDICGCSAGSMYTGILPQFSKNFVGARYYFRHFRTSHPTTDGSKLLSDDVFHSWDIYARFYPHKRVQLFASLPLNYFRQTESGVTVSSLGIGDMQLWANYAILQSADSSKNKVNHTLLAGGGIKMATGESNAYRKGEKLNANMQPGTGSWDMIFNIMYTLRIKGWGFQADANTRITTTNAAGYRFGNRVTGALRGFYWARFNNWSLLPQLSFSAEYGGKDRNLGAAVAESGGLVTLAGAGIDAYYKRFVIGINAQQPVTHNLGGGLTIPYQRVNAQITVLF